MNGDELPFDVYSDYVSYWMTHWGTSISFFRQQPIPDENGARQADFLGAIRMSNEHLKVLLFNIVRTVKWEEARTGANYDATDEILAQYGVSREGWQHFWQVAGEVR